MRTARQFSSGVMALGVAVALLAAGAALAQPHPPHFKYEATAIKRELNATIFYPLVYYTIPDGQCTGVLDSDVIPSWCLGVNGISLIARDQLPPHLDILNDLQSAVVYRQENSAGVCAGVAAVKMKISCLNLSADVPPSILNSASGHNWPMPDKKPSELPNSSHDIHYDVNQEENEPSSTEKPPEPMRRWNYLRLQTNKFHNCSESGRRRKILCPLQQHYDIPFRISEGQNWQRSSETQLEPVHLWRRRLFNLKSDEGENQQDFVKNKPFRKLLPDVYDSYSKGSDEIEDSSNQRLLPGLVPCNK